MFLGEKAHTLICIGCLLRDICCSGSAMRSCLFVVSVCNVIVRLVQEPCIKWYLCLHMALGQDIYDAKIYSMMNQMALKMLINFPINLVKVYKI